MRRSPVASLVAMAALIVTAGSAGAATTIGETFVPTVACSGDLAPTFLQTTSPNGQFAAPTDGVITQWSFQSAATGTDKIKFKVARSAGGNDFTMIGESDLVDPVTDTLNQYFTRIPVQAGDIIGMYWAAGNSSSPGCGRSKAGYSHSYKLGDVTPPTTATFTPFTSFPFELDISARLEPDCDNDGLGDESQDADISSCAPTPPPQSPPSSPPSTTPPPAPGPSPVATPPTCQGKQATIVGTEGGDALTGTAAADVIVGLGGNDVIKGGDQADVICGNGGDDVINGKSGEDVLFGEEGNDRLNGAGKNDQLFGGTGKDRLGGGFGRDRLFGGPGADQLFGGFGKDTLKGGPGKDKQVQ